MIYEKIILKLIKANDKRIKKYNIPEATSPKYCPHCGGENE